MPVPDAPDVIVRNVALLVAVHEQLEAAVTGKVPVVAPPETFVVTLPTVTEQDDPDGDESLFEHAAAASATPAETMTASSRRWNFMAGYSSPDPVRYTS